MPKARVVHDGAGTHFGSTGDPIGFGGATPVSLPKTGWADPTGTATRSTFATGSVTLPNLAQAVMALILDLKSIGLLGA
jgi:hypothetical protein